MAQLSPSTYVELYQSTNRTFDPYMPVVVVGAIVGGVVLAVASGIHTTFGQLSAFGAVCYATVIAITVPTNLRINKQVARYLQEGAQRLQVLMRQVPDLTVDVRDVIADGDKVVIRAVWSGTDAVSQKKVEFHGFVQWRIVDGKFAERWATVTPIVEIPEGTNVW